MATIADVSTTITRVTRGRSSPMDSARQADQGFDQSAPAKPSSEPNEPAELEAHSACDRRPSQRRLSYSGRYAELTTPLSRPRRDWRFVTACPNL